MPRCTVKPVLVGSGVSPPGWTPVSHSHDNAVGRLQQSLKNVDQNLLSEWFLESFDDLHKVLINYRIPESLILLHRYFSYFSRIVFDGALTLDNCEVRLVMAEGANKEEWERHSGEKAGYCEYKTDSKRIRRAYITIFENIKFADNPRARLRRYLGVLLHEMLHAFLDLYCCRCVQCNPKRSLLGHGKTGHGLHYLRAAKDIELFMLKTLYLELSLSRSISLAYELLQNKLKLKSVRMSQVRLTRKVNNDLQRLRKKDQDSDYESDTHTLDYYDENQGYDYEGSKKRKLSK